MSHDEYDLNDPFDRYVYPRDEMMDKIEHNYLDLKRKSTYYEEQISCLENSMCCLVIILIIILSFIFYVLSTLVSSISNIQDALRI